MVLKLQRADGMRNALDRVLNGMRKIVHGIDAPCISRVVMRHVRHAVNNGITHVDVGTCHVDLGAKHKLAVGILALFHLLKKAKVLLYAPVAVRIVLARLRKGSAVLFDLLRRQIRHVSLALLNELNGALIHLTKIVGRKE